MTSSFVVVFVRSAGQMRTGVGTRLPKNDDVVCGLHSALQYGRTWAERGMRG